MAIKGLNPEWMEQQKGKNPVAKIGWIRRKTLDIPYAQDGELQRLDIYLPDTEQAVYPVIVNVHGGGWMVCDKRDFHLYPTMYALQRGYAVMAVNYRLSPEVRYPEHIADVLKALEWLGENGAQYHLDTKRVFLWGTSAGGNTVLQIGCKQGVLARTDTCDIRGIAALCPAVDGERLGGVSKKLPYVLWTYFTRKKLTRDVLGGKEHSRTLRPLMDVRRYLAHGIAPVYLQHGMLDYGVPYAAAQDLAQLLEKQLPPQDFVFDSLQGAGHAGGGPDFFLEKNVQPILDFFDRHQ